MKINNKIINALLPNARSRIAKFGIPFLIVGTINTLFGYFGSVGFYELMKDTLSLPFIIILSRIICITFSFMAYKIFVFKSDGRWLKEYIKCYMVYGFTSTLIMIVVYCQVELLSIHFWVAQLVGTGISIVANFIAHTRFTFSHPK